LPVVPFLPAIAGVAGAAIGANAQNKAAKQAAAASQNATDQTIAEQRRQFDIGQQNMQPWLDTGRNALSVLGGMYGLTGAPSARGGLNWDSYLTANPDVAAAIQGGAYGGEGGIAGAAQRHYDEYGRAEGRAAPAAATPYDSFIASPDYQFRQDEQMRALTARNAALGIQDSGAAQRSALQLSGNLASSEFNNYANRLASLAGVGQAAAQGQAAAGANFANSMGNVLGNNAQNLASSYAQQGENNANLWSGIGGVVGSGLNQYFGRR